MKQTIDGKLRLAVVCPDPADGTSLVRGVGPLAAMARQDRRLELDLCQVNADGSPWLSWDWLVRCDALFLQRPWNNQHIGAAVTARMFGLPVWVDWDDDLTSVSRFNPQYATYPAAPMKAAVAKLMSLADVVSVSTEHLRERLLGLVFSADTPKAVRDQLDAGKVRVIPNACAWGFNQSPRQKRVVWRGGTSHNEDVLEFLPAIREVSRLPQFVDWKWTFLGNPPPQVYDAILPGNLDEPGFVDSAHMYMSAFGYLGPWLAIVPLKDNLFNHSKSNLAWIEATCAGAITLGPDWPEWQQPGIVNYDDVPSFKNKLKHALELYGNGTIGAERVAASRKFISESLTLEKVNEQRWEVLRELTGTAESGKQKAEMQEA